MITYMKELYPELTKTEFDKYILPLAKGIEKISVDCSELDKFVKINEKEVYPYHNVCRTIAFSLWTSNWDISLNQDILNPDSFRNVSCERLSQLAFSYLIRCFAEDIKTLAKDYEHTEEIYRYYTQNLVNSGFSEFSKIYKVTWKRCINLLRNKICALKETIKIIRKHRIDLEKDFYISRTSRISHLEVGGDTHNNGTSVTIISFENNKKIVFKPRSVSGELAYSKLIKKLNSFISPPMQSIDVLDYGNYGFTSYVESDNEKCDMVQAGRLASLMYFLNATDMHFNNILWTRQGPVPIDTETLFHPPRVRMGIPESDKNAYRVLETSVYGTGILPLDLRNKNSNESVDVGFAGIREENAVSPFKNFSVIDGFSPNIKVVWNQPKIDNKLSNDKQVEKLIHERCADMVEGFRDFFVQIFKQKERFKEAVLETFQNVELRYIHNMTYRYVQILRCLTDAEPSRNIDIAHALLARIAILNTTSDTNLILSECRQIWNGDIPYFSRKFDGTEICSENIVIAHTSTSAKKEFISKIDNLQKSDLTRQLNLIRLAFVAKLADTHAENRLEFNQLVHSVDKETKHSATNILYSDHRSIEHAIDWFTNALVESVLDDRYAHLPKTWIGPIVRYGNPGWTPGVLGYDLYAGRIGPALSLAAAGRARSNEKALKVAEEVFDRSAQILESKTYELRNVLMSGIGGFSGISGLLWAFCAASELTGNKQWRDIAVDSWKLLPDAFSIKKENFFDMIMGPSASIIMRYNTETDWRLDEQSLQKCLSAAYSKLVQNNAKNTSGLAHGLGQILWFFSSVFQRGKEENIKQIIIDVDCVIKEQYTDDKGFIQIYREANNKVSSSWCNGLAGILLAYYEGYRAGCLSEESVINIINQLKMIPLSSVPILCHGSLGIADILQYVKDSFPNQIEQLLFELEKAFCTPEYVLNYFKKEEGRYPLSPGLMAGKAGALLYLCKKLDPTINISPLTLGINI